MKTYLITGASSGLGASVAEALDDADIVTMGRHDAGPVPRSAHLPCDFMHVGSDQIAGLVTGWASRCNKFDGIIHCAGAEVMRPLNTVGGFEKATFCASAAYGLLQAAASGAVEHGGSIVLMSSVAAHRGTPGLVAYSAGKAAIEGMTRSASVELAPRRIRVNAIAAGAFASPMHQRIINRMSPASVAAYAAKHPLGFGEVERVRDAVLYLLSDAASWTTGSVMVVDGGLSA